MVGSRITDDDHGGNPAPEPTPAIPDGAGRRAGRSRLALAAEFIAALVAATLVAAFAIFAVAYLIGGWAAIDDTWVGLIAAIALIGGLLLSLIGCVLAVLAIRRERRASLWLPLLLFPAIVTFLLIGELFWWE